VVQAKGKYKNDLKEGKWEFYDERGRMYKKQSFIEGKPTGKWVEYYINGKKKGEGQFNGIKRDGVWTYWDKDGKVVYKVRYNNGQKVEVLVNARAGFIPR